MHDNARLDDELAAFTDGLLAGEDVPAPTGLEELAQVVRQLNALIAPAERPSPAFREHLTQRLNREWTLQHQRRTRFRFSRRLVQVAAVVVVILGALVVLALNSENESVQGTALGSASGIVVIVVVLLAIGVAIFWFHQHRNL
jgi:lipopolysaccharide export LptBFGC system permease protein LptF